MKRLLTLVMLLVFFVVLIGCTNVRGTKNVPRISKDDLKSSLGSPNLFLVDVRAEKDWEKSDGKITGAVRMDPKGVEEWSGTLPKDKEIVLYCA